MAKRRNEAGGVGARAIIIGSGFVCVTVFVFGLGVWVGRELGGRPATPSATQIVASAAPTRPADDEIPRPVTRDFYNDHRKAIERGLAGEPSSEAMQAEESAPAAPATATTATPTATRRLDPTATQTRVQTPTMRPPATPTLRAPATPTAVTTARAATGRWVVYVAETTSEQQAFALNGDLRQRGLTATTDEHRERGVRVFRIRIGPFATRDEATAQARRLQQTGKYPDAYAAPR